MRKNFRLQKVLEYRERLVDLEKNKLAELNSHLERVKIKIAETEELIDLKVKERETADGLFRNMYDKYIGKLTEDRNKGVKLRKQIELNIELQKKKVVEAIERQKIMQKLKDKHVDSYRNYLNKEEMKMIDELAVTRSARNED